MDKELKKATIMVIDDIPDNLKLLQEMLQNKGFRVLAFPQGMMALNAAVKNPPALILLDIKMPVMDGFEVCKRLKADETLKDIPVLFISALSDTTDKVKAFSLGCVDYITKPFQFNEVNARVEAHLEIRRQKRELQQAYDKLLELETQRDSLVHMIVHDLRSPLQNIILSLQLLKKMPNDEDGYIDVAISSTKKISDMVSGMLDVNKIEAGQMTLALSTFDIRTLVSEAIQMLNNLQFHRNLTIISAEEIFTISADKDMIRRVIENLISNAFKFTDKEKGIITVNIKNTAEDKVRVSVTDNGYGIPLEYREKVFDKFFQVTANKQTQMRSTGLGLTFCKLAVEAHGGCIGLESNVDKGITFWFELPRR